MLEIINALLIEPGEKPSLVLIENSTACIQGLIGEQLVQIQPWKDNMTAIFAKNGERDRKKPNRLLIQEGIEHIPVAPVYGSLLLCNATKKDQTRDTHTLTSMSINQASKYMLMFSIPDEIQIDKETRQKTWKVYQQFLNGIEESEEY